MNAKLLGIVAIVLVFVGLGAYWQMNYMPESDDVQVESASLKMANTSTYEWNLTELGEHASAPGVPRTGVTLTADGTTYPIGEFNGSCTEIANSSWSLVQGEVSGVICWWAGGGDEIGIFDENGVRVVKVGQLDEGSAEVEGFRGGFETILTLE